MNLGLPFNLLYYIRGDIPMSIICVYKIVNKQNGRAYIGSTVNVEERFSRHRRDLRSGNHHCIYLQRAWDKYGEDSFTFEVVKHGESESEVRKMEEEYLEKEYDSLYNTSKKSTGGDLITYHPERERIVKRIKEASKARYSTMSSEERRRVYARPGKLNPNYGRRHTEETKRKISEANKGNQYAKGAKRSEEARKKLSELASSRTGEKNPFFGKTHSEETKKKLAEANRGKLPPNIKPVSIDGCVYESASSAARAIGCVTATILNRIKSEKYPTYKFIDS